MDRISAITCQATSTSALNRRLSTTITAVFETLISKTRIQESVGDELIVNRSDTTKALHIELNRPKKLNALSFSQVKYLARLFPILHRTPPEECSAVIVTGAGDKAFCAGGDIKSLTSSTDPPIPSEQFFANEYCADIWSKALNRPYLSIWDGITFGGGVGISVHGGYRIATEATSFAMPETAIGFFPDIGATYFLPRLKNGMGLYLGLTGTRLNAADVVELGLATHFIKKESLNQLIEKLMGHNSSMNPTFLKRSAVDEILASLESSPLMSPMLTPEIHQEIKNFFHGIQSLKELIERLSAGISDRNAFAIRTMETLKMMCPLSCGIWIEQNNRGPHLSLAECLSLEYRLCQSFYNNDPHNNFKEGVRALLGDRCGKPNWNPALLTDVTPEQIKSHFEWTKGKQLFQSPDLEFPKEFDD